MSRTRANPAPARPREARAGLKSRNRQLPLQTRRVLAKHYRAKYGVR